MGRANDAIGTVVAVDNLSFSYGTTPVLQELDLSVDAGEVVCLLGPNGVGKTTLVENLLGSLTPTSGSIRVLGLDPRRAGAEFWARVGPGWAKLWVLNRFLSFTTAKAARFGQADLSAV